MRQITEIHAYTEPVLTNNSYFITKSEAKETEIHGNTEPVLIILISSPKVRQKNRNSRIF